MENDQRTSSIEKLKLNMRPRTNEGPIRYSMRNVSIAGSCEGLKTYGALDLEWKREDWRQIGLGLGQAIWNSLKSPPHKVDNVDAASNKE
jgi:hypothetical protein